jgi:hypothetical protein
MVETFTNEYGEQWQLIYDTNTNIGLLTGSDVDWKTYYVVDGNCHQLILNKDEKEWLKKSWDNYSTKL